MMDDARWRQIINGLDAGDLPADGKDAPPIESMKRNIKDGESPVVLQKIITEVYVYTSTNTKDMWYGSDTLQDIQIIGTMRLADAHKIIATAKRKRRRK